MPLLRSGSFMLKLAVLQCCSVMVFWYPVIQYGDYRLQLRIFAHSFMLLVTE